MQNAAIFTAAHNGVIGRKARAVTGKLVKDFAFKLIFEHARTTFFHRAGVGQRADFARTTHSL
ncbi:hypothetical protein D3C87_1936100 [compost metagenome]